MRAFVVAGPAGAGKSTLGAALARRAHAALVDLDTLTNPLLDALGDAVAPGGHWNDDALRPVVRPARYAALRATARAQVQAGVDVVLVAPFTAELAGGDDWSLLETSLVPAAVTVVWLDASPALRDARVRARGERRDAATVPAEVPPPGVPHVRVDAALATADQVSHVLGDC
ncbi:AAA family ATPase [Solicola sp. PLA-1-18]|uniref:AAA family ATPase n=1 Tax=Solicola sp. PLA-1-18 TaxID=3380532 RepID=UPI003B78789E